MINVKYLPAIKKLRKIAQKLENQFNGESEFTMTQACLLSSKIEKLRWAALILEASKED